jgi:hypothetical protein
MSEHCTPYRPLTSTEYYSPVRAIPSNWPTAVKPLCSRWASHANRQVKVMVKQLGLKLGTDRPNSFVPFLRRIFFFFKYHNCRLYTFEPQRNLSAILICSSPEALGPNGRADVEVRFELNLFDAQSCFLILYFPSSFGIYKLMVLFQMFQNARYLIPQSRSQLVQVYHSNL